MNRPVIFLYCIEDQFQKSELGRFKSCVKSFYQNATGTRKRDGHSFHYDNQGLKVNVKIDTAPEPKAATILLVEDEVLVRLVIADHFRSEGLKVIEARNGDAALSVLQAIHPINLVITDLRMPGSVSGVMLVELVKRKFGLPLIVISGNLPDEAVSSLADTVFEKPVDIEHVFATALEILGSKGNG
jgi:CheY-like chemotaxis protein